MRLVEPGKSGLLLIPVSGGSGSGELQRARLIARTAQGRWPDLPIAIAAATGALASCSDHGVQTIALPHSPTRSTAQVIAAIESVQPRVVLFDSTARPAQLRAAHGLAAQVIYLSSRPSARARGFRLGALRYIDQHWSVEFAASGRIPNVWQRWLLARRTALRWRALSTLFEPADARLLPAPVRHFTDSSYALFCPGGGGGQVDGQTAALAFAAAAAACGKPSIVVRADLAPGYAQQQANCLVLGALPNAALMALLRDARIAVLGAGSLLLQALAVATPTLALALASDQPARLKRLLALGVVRSCPARVTALAESSSALWDDADAQQQLRHSASQLGLRNGLDEAMESLAQALGRGGSATARAGSGTY